MHSIIYITKQIFFFCVLQDDEETANQHGEWLSAFWADFRRRFVNLLGYEFRKFSPGKQIYRLQISCLLN
jgi:hypothetical protein